MIEVLAPRPFDGATTPKLFLAGSIDNGQAEPWQADVVQELADLDVVILNPRRERWEPDWAQSLDNPSFVEQVAWELRGLEEADVILMYLAPGSKAPISLLELGLFGRTGKMHVVCPEAFWRKGNVDVVCERYAIPRYASLPEGLRAVRGALLQRSGG
ncbi:nucleoside 2-deoxyribosyltransferase domain-containing protein [Sorangium sp. So ce362]|uniref:nucleoside 2-deoxyribosyltransferase domain-containing protein n=1 Tax=Sorangium sp. So ce362 TaxID=3133303 RepID=UPI003F60DD71